MNYFSKNFARCTLEFLSLHQNYFIRLMQIRIIFIFSFILCIFTGYAQQTPLELKYKTWDLHALRYYPFTQPADSFMMHVIDRNPIKSKKNAADKYEKIAVDFVMNKEYLANMINHSTANQTLIFKYVMLPYLAWLNYARPVHEDAKDLNLTLFLSENSLKENQQTHSSAQSPLELVGAENIQYFLEEWLGEVDVWKERNDVLFKSFKSPLAKDAWKTYRYFFSSRTEVDSIPVYEIAFFPHKVNEKAFEGYLYISISDLIPMKAEFTLNSKIKKQPVKTVLFTQTPSKKETRLAIGDEMGAGFFIDQVRNNNPQNSIFEDNLSPPQKEIAGLVEEAKNTRAFSNLQNVISLFFTDKIGIFKDNFNLGPITQMLSYNYMEGIRLRVGGFTSESLNKQVSVGGYLAYGTKDEKWKYRGDFIYSPSLKNKFRITYVNDLAIPGQDFLEDKRDLIFYSIYQSHTKNLSLQKIGQLSFETEKLHPFSLKLHAKYTYDQPVGLVKYETVNNEIKTTVKDITTSEIGASICFSPNERYIYIKGKRVVFRSPDLDIRLIHRIGIKGIIGSDYNYNITDASIFKSFDLPTNKGVFRIRFSGGKVWNPVPFPLLFIPSGNQSYVYGSNNYNLMRFYEFTTDRFVAGNADLQINWSPIKLVFHKSKMKMHGGFKTIYGPLSDENNPQLHPELFVFNNGVEALSDKPYAEANIGISGILHYLRLDYVYRLNYGRKGSLFVSTAINF